MWISRKGSINLRLNNTCNIDCCIQEDLNLLVVLNILGTQIKKKLDLGPSKMALILGPFPIQITEIVQQLLNIRK